MRVRKQDFEQIVYQKLDALPKQLQEKIDNVAVFVVPDPPAPRILGLYQGVPFPKRKNPGYSLIMPDKILLFQHPIQAACATPEQLERLIDDVLLHEIGHYLGLSERQLRDLSRQ